MCSAWAPGHVCYRGANIERLDADNFTPLLLAASAGHAQAVATLLERGADISATDKYDKTAIYWCAQENNVGALEVPVPRRGSGLATVQSSSLSILMMCTMYVFGVLLFGGCKKDSTSYVRCKEAMRMHSLRVTNGKYIDAN